MVFIINIDKSVLKNEPEYSSDLMGLYDEENDIIEIYLPAHFHSMVDEIIDSIIHEHIHQAINELGERNELFAAGEETTIEQMLDNDQTE